MGGRGVFRKSSKILGEKVDSFREGKAELSNHIVLRKVGISTEIGTQREPRREGMLRNNKEIGGVFFGVLWLVL